MTPADKAWRSEQRLFDESCRLADASAAGNAPRAELDRLIRRCQRRGRVVTARNSRAWPDPMRCAGCGDILDPPVAVGLCEPCARELAFGGESC